MKNISPGERVLITGGSGSLGSALIPALLAAGARIRVLSRDEKKQLDVRRQYSDVDCRLGDVRDPRAVFLAVQGMETVIHAASLKYVDVSERQPTEYVQTNVVGTMNVLEACQRSDTVRRVVGISTDKVPNACVDWFAPIELADGSSVRISKLVSDRRRARVKSIDGDTITSASVTGWFKNSRAGRGMVRVMYDGMRSWGRHGLGVWVTEDHPVLTTEGWKKAGELTSADLLVVAEPAPNDRQLAFLVGTLLGDASLSKTSGKARSVFALGYCARERQWLTLKTKALRGFHFGKTTRRTRHVLAKGKQKIYSSVRITGSPCLAFSYLRSEFYPDGVKRVPRLLVSLAMRTAPAVFLAAWYLDDGCVIKNRGNALPAARIATHGFVEDDVRWLADLLSGHGFTSYAYECRAEKGSYWELRFRVDGAARLFAMIGKAVPYAMRRKVPRAVDRYDPRFWDLGESTYSTAPAQTSRADAPVKRDVYCLEVEGTQNFTSLGVVLHNCNTYGLTKALLEKLFVEAHQDRQHKAMRIGKSFVVARYGNVVGTRGSVVPFWAEQRRRGEPLIVTDPAMTRFFFTLDDAVRLIDVALAAPSGTVVAQPMPACTLGDLARAMSGQETRYRVTGRAEGDCESLLPENIKIVGRRSGEKVHEELLTAEEMARTVERDGCFHYEPLGERRAFAGMIPEAYTSDRAPRLSDAALLAMLKEWL